MAYASTSVYGLETINKLYRLCLVMKCYKKYNEYVVAITKGEYIVGHIPTEIYAKNTIIVINF